MMLLSRTASNQIDFSYLQFFLNLQIFVYIMLNLLGQPNSPSKPDINCKELKKIATTINNKRICWKPSKPTQVIRVVLAWNLHVCSSQGLKFDYTQSKFRHVSLAYWKKQLYLDKLLFFGHTLFCKQHLQTLFGQKASLQRITYKLI